MKYLREARFPFTRSPHMAEIASMDPRDLVSSPSYAKARERGLKRVTDAIRDSEVSYEPLTDSEYDRVMEVMSYPYARMLVSSVNDRFLTKRYALAESIRMRKLLSNESHASVISLSKELGVNTVDVDGELRMHFSDYIKFSVRIKSQEWKLVNTELHKGFVSLQNDRLFRVLQNALQDRIETELPIAIPDDIKKQLKKDSDHVIVMLGEMKERYGGTGGDIDADLFPPCMRSLLAGTQNGINLPHSGRFALVSFLHCLGMDSEQILTLFSQSPDFDASKSSYQIRHITGELPGSQEYTPPECSTMKSYGICFDPDALCNNEWMKHPLSYYRIKIKDKKK